MEENQFIISHAHETLRIAQRCKDLTWTLNNNLACWISIKEELLLQIRDIESLEIFLLNKSQRLTEVFDSILWMTELNLFRAIIIYQPGHYESLICIRKPIWSIRLHILHRVLVA